MNGQVLLLTALAAMAGVFGVQIPDTCTRLECPDYTVTDSNDVSLTLLIPPPFSEPASRMSLAVTLCLLQDYETRLYSKSYWATTEMQSQWSSYNGFMTLFDYIQGDNKSGNDIKLIIIQ